MNTRLSPGDYLFVTAPLEEPWDSSARCQYPADLWEPGSKWFFVEAVPMTSGGGTVRDVYRGDYQSSVGTSISALYAKAKADIPDSARPWQVGDECISIDESLHPVTKRKVERCVDHWTGQRIWLAPLPDFRDYAPYSAERLVRPIEPWDLVDLCLQLRQVATDHGVPGSQRAALAELLKRVHVLVSGVTAAWLPPPQFARDPDTTIDLTWFSRKRQTAVGITILHAGNVNGKVWLHSLVGTAAP